MEFQNWTHFFFFLALNIGFWKAEKLRVAARDKFTHARCHLTNVDRPQPLTPSLTFAPSRDPSSSVVQKSLCLDTRPIPSAAASEDEDSSQYSSSLPPVGTPDHSFPDVRDVCVCVCDVRVINFLDHFVFSSVSSLVIALDKTSYNRPGKQSVASNNESTLSGLFSSRHECVVTCLAAAIFQRRM